MDPTATASSIHIRLAEYADEHSWDSFVESFVGAPPYCLFPWKKTVEKAYGFFCPYLLAESPKHDNVLRGILPLVHIKPPFFSGTLVSLPYCDAGGVLAENQDVAYALLHEAENLLHQLGAKTLEIRLTAEAEGLSHLLKPQPSNKVRMLLPLPESTEELLSGFKAKLRSQINKPSRDGLSGRLGGKELLTDFYTVFGEGMRDLGSPPHSKQWFSCLLENFGHRARIGIVYMPSGEPAAAGIILCCRNSVTIPWASSMRRYNRWNPNMLLYWNFLSFAVDNGYRLFDFGRSTPGEGTYRFKQQWGATPAPLFWTTFAPNERQDNEQAFSNRQGLIGNTRSLVEGVWKRLPIPFSNVMGAGIRRYVSL